MKSLFAIRLSFILLLMAALFTLASCHKSNNSDQTGVANPVPSDKSTTAAPRFNKEAWSGQGQLAFTWENRLYILNGDDGTLTMLSKTDRDAKPQWSPNGEWLAYISDENQLIITRADGSTTHEITGLPVPVNSLDYAWSPNSNMLAVTTGVDGHGIYLARPGETLRQIISVDTFVSSFAWSPDGKTIAYVDTLPYDKGNPVNRNDALYIIPKEGGEPLRLHIKEAAGIIIAGWRPGGKELLFWINPGRALLVCGRLRTILPAAVRRKTTSTYNHPSLSPVAFLVP